MSGTYVVIVDLRQNNGRHCGIVGDPDGQWLERFRSVEEVRELKARHPLGLFPWILVSVEHPDVGSFVLV